ncbi:MAG: alpha/beta fold hydrolase [Edaphobacter sp.]
MGRHRQLRLRQSAAKHAGLNFAQQHASQPIPASRRPAHHVHPPRPSRPSRIRNGSRQRSGRSHPMAHARWRLRHRQLPLQRRRNHRKAPPPLPHPRHSPPRRRRPHRQRHPPPPRHRGSAHSLLNPVFSNLLFGPGQPLDITKFFIILPDDIGHGESSKPSDGLRMHFPQYDYDDMVASQHAMLVDGLHVDHLRLILGTSMGCMQSFVWGETYSQFADALAPFACLPIELAGRNRLWRYMAIEDIKHDPAWQNGDYATEPVEGLRGAMDLLIVAGGAPLQLQKNYPTRAQIEAYADKTIADDIAHTDANNFIYYINASRNYNPSPKLSTITAPVLWINSADDFINPPELGIAEKLVTQIPHARFILIPISDATRGHGTHTQAAVWKQYLIDFLARTDKK